MKKKLLAVGVIGVLMASMLTGCTESTSSKENSYTEETKNQILDMYGMPQVSNGYEYSQLKEIYELSGYKVIPVSSKSKMNIDKVKEELNNSVVVFAGPSGVGKSSLLNEIDPNFELQTGEVSDKIKRGKHTTRHAELLKLQCGGIVADTPGFSSLTLDDIEENELKDYFIEFDEVDTCRFGNKCRHENEPGCGVKEAVEAGEISKVRYDSYIQLLNEIRQGKRRY